MGRMTGRGRGGGQNTSSTSGQGSTAQNVNVTDLICEGPIKGLVDGVGSLYLDDVSVEDAKFSDFKPESTLNGSITFSGSAVGTVSSTVDMSSLQFDENSSRTLELLYKQTTATLVSQSQVFAKRVLVLDATSGTPFDASFASGSQLSGAAHALVVVSHPEAGAHAGTLTVTDSNTVNFSTVYGTFPSTGTYTISVYYFIPITGINNSNNQITLSTTPASASYEFNIGGQQQFDDDGQVAASSSTVVRKINKLNIDFRRGNLEQPTTSSVGGVGSAVGIAGNTGNISGPQELKIISQALSTSLGIAIIDKQGLPNSDGSKTFPGSPDYSVMSDSATVLPSSAFGLNTSAKIAEVDEIGWTIRYPALQIINVNKGDKETAYVFYVMQIRFQQNGAYGDYKALFPGRGKYVVHSGNTGAPISFDHQVNLDGYRNIIGPFEDFQVRIVRVTRHIGLPVRSSGANEGNTDKKKWQLAASAGIESLRAVIKDNLSYPYSSLASISFSSRQFDGMPKTSYLLQGKLVKVPNTYTPREYSDTGIAKYEGFWNGDFHTSLAYTDNPAWVFYDIVTNNRYGAGKWIKDLDIDKYALYRIARYCDELVDDGSEYDSTKPLVVGQFYRIKTTGNTAWTSLGAANNNVNTIFQSTGTTITGTGVACRVEPRFRANVFLTKATDVYKVLKDFSTIFLGIIYWQDSKIMAVQDAPQDPVYNFTKGNVIDGTFAYESTGSRTRSNQVVVTWNDPTINYEPVPLIVEDRESIARTGRIISENVVAFGATSESQAIRYGRWKLWTAQNQTEIISFKTSLAAHFIKPGDVINVQDADRFGIAYSGRTSSATSTTLTFDRNVSFNSGSTYELSSLVTAPAALNASEGSITINSVTYARGEKIDQAFVYNGSAYVLTNLDTEKRASNAFTDSSGTELIPTIWKPYSYVETHEITNPASTTNVVTLANSATFDTTPSKNSIWALKETVGGLNVASSEKMYKVLGITEDSPNIFSVSAVAYFDEKFTAIEEDYALGTLPESIYIENEPTTLPRPINPRIVLATDAQKPGEELLFEWDEPESDADSIVQYEVLHTIEGIDNPIKTNTRQVVFNNVPNGSVTFKVRAVSRLGNLSSYTAIDYGVYDPYGENVPRMAGGIPKGIISTAQGVIDSNNFKFQATNTSVASITNPFITYTITGTKNISTVSTGREYYLYLDVATPSLKLLEYDSTAFADLQFYRDVGTGNAALSTAWTSIGSVTIAANSNEVTGSGFNSNVQLRDVLNLSNSTSPSGGDGATVISIISDTKLLIDRTFNTAKSGITAYRSAFRPDYANDSIFAEITKTGSTISTNNFITLRTASDDTEGTTETLDDGTIAVKDGGISVDKIAANSITADKIAANSITTEQLAANSITANQIAANTITTQQLGANSITANQIAANSIDTEQLSANSITSNQIVSTSIVSTLIDATKVTASDIQTATLSALSANLGDITAGTMKGGSIPDANAAPGGSETGAFMDLTNGRMVFGNASKHVLFDGTNLILSGVTIDANSINQAGANLVVKEGGTQSIADAESLNFTASDFAVSSSGTEATISLDSNITNKLAGIEAFADVTDTTNVVAALNAGTNITISANGTISSTFPTESIQDIVGGMVSGNTESGITVTYQDSDGTIDFSVSSQTDENFTTALKNKLNGIADNANNYTLPVATASALGGIRIGYTENGRNYPVELSSNKAFVNVPWVNTEYSQATSSTLGLVKIGYTENGRNYPVELSNGQMYVNVPWVDTNTLFTAGSGLSLSGSNQFSVDSTVVRTTGTQTIAGNKTFSNNVVVNGNFTVNGTTTTINTTNLVIEDNKIVVNSSQSGTPASSVTAGIEVERGSSSNKSFVYAESGVGESGNTTSGWTFGSERVQAGTFFGTFVGDVTGTPSSLTGLTTDNLTEGTNNLYFTNTRARAAISGSAGISYSSSNGQISVDTTVVRTSGAQTIAGTKTFSNGIVSSGAITGTSFVIGSANISEAELETIDSVTAGIVSGSKAVVVDSNKDISGFRNVQIGGNITVSGTVDGRDVASDGSKLDGIDANATNTADPAITTNGSTPSLASGISGAEIRSAIGAGTGTVSSLSDLSITSTATEINKLDGFTGVVADLNYAKNLRATGVTSTEFDHLDGVTSNIQTQLNGKQASGSYLTAHQDISGKANLSGATFTGDVVISGGAGGLTITNSDIRSNATSTWTGNPGTQGKIQYHSNRWYIVADSSSNRIVQFRRNGSDKSYIDNNGKFIGDVDQLDGQHGSYYLDYNNFTNTPTIPSAANNATITLAGGAGLLSSGTSGGGSFTTNQGTAETITFAVGAGTGISVSANAVALATAGAGAGTYGSTADDTKIDQITLDAYGRVTAVSTGPIDVSDAAITTNGSTPSLASGITAAEIRSLIGAGTSSTNGDITNVTAGTGLSGGGASGSVTLNVDLSELTSMNNQTMTTSDEFIVLDNGADRKITASDVINDLNIMTGNVTGTLLADVIVANKIETDMLKANTITTDKLSANIITATQLNISNNSAGSAGIFFDFNSGQSRIDIRDSSALRVRIGYLA